MNGLVLFSTSTCGPCRAAKQWMHQHGVQFTEINLTVQPNYAPWVQQQTGQRTVPQFFLNGQWLPGGFPAVQAMMV